MNKKMSHCIMDLRGWIENIFLPRENALKGKKWEGNNEKLINMLQ